MGEPAAADETGTGVISVAAAVRNPARVAAVRATGLLDAETEEVFDRLSRLAVRLAGVPAAFLSLVDERRDFYLSTCGFGEPFASARELTGPTFCHYALASPGPLVIPDTTADPVYRDVPTVRTLGVAAYVGVPVTVGGQRVGSFCAIDTRPRTWTDGEVEVLTELAASAERELELRAAAARLREQQAELERSNRLLQEQAVELEAQAEELQATAAYLEEKTEEAEEARRLAESERSRATGVLEATADAYFALDAGYRLVGVNGAMERGVGLARGQIIGRSMWDAFPGTVGNAFERAYRSAAENRAESHFTHDYSDGRLALVTEVDVYPGPDGGVAVFWRDVTARAQIEAALAVAGRAAEAARREAEAANRAKSEFLAVMSHELRTPLNAIGGYAELIELGIHGPVTDAQRTALARIQQSQRHLLGIIAGVLDYSRLEAGAVTYQIADVSVAEAVVEAEVLVAPQLRAKRIEYAWSGAPPGLAVRADRAKLQQVLLNLLGNSIKFTDPGGRVTVGCARAGDSVNPEVHLVVTDTGMGIAESELARIFEPFVQVDSALTRTRAGTGLGLAIGRDLARGMGGDLTVTSTLDVGSTFTLILPAVIASTSEQ